MQHSKRRAKERNEKENRFEEEYAKAKQDFEADPNNINLKILSAGKESLEAFTTRNLTESSYVLALLGTNSGRRVQNIFLTLKKGII